MAEEEILWFLVSGPREDCSAFWPFQNTPPNLYSTVEQLRSTTKIELRGSQRSSTNKTEAQKIRKEHPGETSKEGKKKEYPKSNEVAKYKNSGKKK